MRRVVPLLSWFLALVSVAVVMVVAGQGALAPPPVGPERWGAWAGTVGPAAAALAIVRLVVLVLVAYLMAATALAVTAEMVRSAVIIDLSEVLALPAIRRAVHAALGVSLVGVTVAGGAAMLQPARPSTAAAASADPLLGPAPTLEVLSPRPTTVPSTTVPSTTVPSTTVPSTTVPSTTEPAAASQAEASWTVAPGDHLWSVARRLLAAAWHREPSDAEVGPYWEVLVDANRHRLRDPENADLVYPGDELLVPGLPSVPA